MTTATEAGVAKFDKNKIKPGDGLVLVSNQAFPLVFKGMGHNGAVIASYWNPKSRSQFDGIFRQKDVLMAAKA